VGTTAGANAVSSGQPVEQQKPEYSRVIEGSVRYHRERFDTSLFAFVNDVDDNITKQALILPQGAVGTSLGDEPIVAQTEAGAVFVPLSASPVLVRSNFDDARIWGLEHVLNFRLTGSLSLGTVATYLHAEDRRTGAPPNIEGGTPALEGWLRLRWSPAGARYWVEPYLRLVDRNDRLSTLDLEDRRTGATRSRSSIASFFTNGARARGLVSPGPDGVAGNADDVLLPTGETLAQVQTRVLGSANSSVLFPEIPGYATVGVRGELRIAARHYFYVEVLNIGDVNYRGVSWGVDAPGRSLYVRYRLAL
jgi:hemoglobin/transferrin/lactoferrin receptor protein